MTTPTPSPIFISSLPDLQVFLSSIPQSCTLYLDLEGNKLSRNGTLSIITILVYPTRKTSLIDVQALGNSAFITPGSECKTLKAILEDPHTPKCLWDVRNDADALWAHHKVRLAGVTDVQLLENASRAGDKTYLRGLDICVEMDLKLKFMEVHRWRKTKKEVKALMANDIFACRPLDAKTMQYCANDVMYLPALRDVYTKKINSQWMEKAMDESACRVVEACSPAYEPQSEAKKLGPWGSGLGKGMLTMDDWLDKLEEDHMDAMLRDMLGYDDLDDDLDDYPTNSRDVVWDDTFDSCWDR
jgi:exonuclease 3'-5' domain-containing protein 1